MKFERIVIHFKDGHGRARRAIITKNSRVKAIYLSESAASDFLASNRNKEARLERPAESLVRVVNARGQKVRKPKNEPEAKRSPRGVLPRIPRDGDGPGVWYDAPNGVFCW